ncbi:hypothetical protein ACIQ6K_24635 [Streptomyces sp. NPDC096354]|uniref:hypothetical protein n=1 Tax=Streptomyces sp. NPDC096354 TaxID=3366088 RepID=UPI003808FAA5
MTGMPSPSPGQPTREELIARERQRRIELAAQRAANEHPQTSPAAAATPVARKPEGGAQELSGALGAAHHRAVPQGFASAETRNEAAAAVQAVSEAAQAAGCPSPQLDRWVETASAEEMTRQILSIVQPLPPIMAVEQLLTARRAVPGVLTSVVAQRARALLDGQPFLRPAGERNEGHGDGRGGADSTWQLYADYERLRQHGDLPPEAQEQLLVRLPLPVVDDLIDTGCITSKAVPHDGVRSLYLQARLTPSRVDDSGLDALGWDSEKERRGFWLRLARGDVAVLDEPGFRGADEHALAAELRQIGESQVIPDGFAGREWLWCALERLAPQAQVNLRRSKRFTGWYMVRRLHRTLLAAHRAVLQQSRKEGALFRRAWEEATALERVWSVASWEAKNVLAYLLVVNGDGGPRYDEALETLSPTHGRGTREDALSSIGRSNLESNRAVLRQLQQRWEDDHVLNPYVVLGVHDHAPEAVWKGQWRKLRAELDEDGEAAVNQAKDAIQAQERGHAAVPVFTLALMPQTWAAPGVGTSRGIHGAEPMQRHTQPPTPDERDFARTEAARDIVRAACLAAGIPMAAARSRSTSK